MFYLVGLIMINIFMEKQYCWYKLNLDTSMALRSDWSAVKCSNDVMTDSFSAEQIFNQEWLDYTIAKKLYISNALVFKRPAWKHDETAHVDLLSDALSLSTYSINWVINCDDSEMIWYNKPSSNSIIEYTPANTPFLAWPIETLVEIDRCNIRSEAILTRVDVPHAVSVKSQPRISIAARSGLKLSWNLAVEYLRLNNLLIERD